MTSGKRPCKREHGGERDSFGRCLECKHETFKRWWVNSGRAGGKGTRAYKPRGDDSFEETLAGLVDQLLLTYDEEGFGVDRDAVIEDIRAFRTVKKREAA